MSVNGILLSVLIDIKSFSGVPRCKKRSIPQVEGKPLRGAEAAGPGDELSEEAATEVKNLVYCQYFSVPQILDITNIGLAISFC